MKQISIEEAGIIALKMVEDKVDPLTAQEQSFFIAGFQECIKWMNMEKINVSSLALERAAQAWCTDKTSHLVMDTNLALAFAEILDEIWSKPWLGNATTREIIEELSARSDLDYKTVGSK